MFYHIIFKDREICWQYGSRVNYNLDLRVVDGAPKRDGPPTFFFRCFAPFHSRPFIMPVTGGRREAQARPAGGGRCAAGAGLLFTPNICIWQLRST